MKMRTLRVERRKSGSLHIELQLSTNPAEIRENSRLLKNGVAAPALEAIFTQANRYVSKIRVNLNASNLSLKGLPGNVRFRDSLKPHITDSDVEKALSRVLRVAKPSRAFIRKVLRAVHGHFQAQEGMDRVKDPQLESPLKRMRKDKKLTQADFALIAKVSQGHLSEVENGIVMPSEKFSRVLESINLLEQQKEFIRKRQIEIKRRSHHALKVVEGGGRRGVKP